MPWITSAISDIGGREEQQDRHLIVKHKRKDMLLMAIADGAGGHVSGAEAAEAAVDCVKEYLPRLWLSKDPATLLGHLLSECNERVLRVNSNDMACSTLVVLFAKGDEIFWAHVGDSRFYLIRNQSILVTTTDHTITELNKATGANKPDSPNSDKLYMCLGALAEITPDIGSSILREDDTLLLCSDGLWSQVDMQSVASQLADSSLDDEDIASYIGLAKQSNPNGCDNITLVTARYKARLSFIAKMGNKLGTLFK